MRRFTVYVAGAVLLALPTVLAFFSGGFFALPRLWAAIAVWALVAILALVGARPLPTSRPGQAALAGLAFLTGWSALSLLWAPVAGPAVENVERLVLYVGALMAAIAVAREDRVAQAIEPALAVGAIVVIGEGLSGRLLPGVIHLAHSFGAGGRLEQPITYWNSEGALAAVGLLLCARLAGDRRRPPWLNAVAAAAAAPLGLAIFISYSRGAIAAAAVGLIVLVAIDPSWTQLRAAGVTLVSAVVTSAIAVAFPGVVSRSGSLGHRELDGAIFFVILAAVMIGVAIGSRWLLGAERRGAIATGRVGFARRMPLAAAAALAAVAAGLIVGGIEERGHRNQTARLRGASTSRLVSVESNRYDYWRVGLRAFEHHPLLGLGAAGFRVAWLRQRPIPEGVQQVHSLELEMASELGLPGLVGLALLIAGIVLAARRAVRRGSLLAAGGGGAAIVLLLHATIDWDWELPAVILPVLILAGALIAASEAPVELAVQEPLWADELGEPAPA